MRKIYLITLIVTILFTMCGEVHCPGFPESLLSYIPHQERDTIKFTNSSDTLSFVIIEKRVEGSYSFKKNSDCECETGAGVKTNYNEQLDFSIGYSISLSGNDTIHSVVFSHGINDYLRYPNKQTNYTDEYSSHVYDNVLIMQSNSNSKITDVVIAENYGIIRFKEKLGQLWYLIEDE